MWGISWVPWRVFSTVGDIMSTVGDIMSTVGGYLEYRGGCSVLWGDIMKLEYCGGISWYMWGISWVPWECSVPWGTQITKDSPHGTEHPPRYSWYPPRASWYPPRYWTSPTVLKINPHGTHDIPTVLNTLHGTQDIPPHLSWYPPRYWTPPRYSRYPHGTHDIPHGTHDIPHGTHDIPHGTEHPPRYWAPPTVLSTPTVLHTHYTGCIHLIENLQEFNTEEKLHIATNSLTFPRSSGN